MTRLETLKNRLQRIQDNKEFYLGSERIGGKLYRNPKSSRYAMTCTLIQREIRNLEN